jgi:hypothetical protein
VYRFRKCTDPYKFHGKKKSLRRKNRRAKGKALPSFVVVARSESVKSENGSVGR